jgi:hypothetical protein
MSKKYQVILPNWLADYIEIISEAYELTISEVLRLEICFGILSATQQFFPEYEQKALLAKIFKQHQDTKPKDIDREQFHKNISKIFFETRKAVEFRMEKLKKIHLEQEG